MCVHVGVLEPTINTDFTTSATTTTSSTAGKGARVAMFLRSQYFAGNARIMYIGW